MKYLKGLYKYRFLLKELVIKGIKLKYRRSYLGIVWSLIEPILTTVVLVIVFGTLFNNTANTFPLYIVSGRLIYTFFSNGTRLAATSIRRNSAMIKKVYVPKYLYPLADVLYNFVVFLISLVVIVVVAIYTRTAPTVMIWQCFVGLIIALLLTTGTSMFLSALDVFFRDIEYLWNVALLFIMYLSAIFYYPDRILESGWSWVLNFNPLYCVIDIFRAGILGTTAPIWDYAYAFSSSIVLLIAGTYLFWKKQDDFILHI